MHVNPLVEGIVEFEIDWNGEALKQNCDFPLMPPDLEKDSGEEAIEIRIRHVGRICLGERSWFGLSWAARSGLAW